ncbi:MAG TPA: glycosyltransferase family 39 protein, partial [Chitinophagales bacterium]|nr:glycosyltransferase family 39 protein [Chitinophagales bacterium]
MREKKTFLNLSEGNSSFYKRLFFSFIGIIALIFGILSQSTGISGDEKYHTYITEHVLNFYTSFGKDTSLFISKKEALALIKEHGEQGAEEMGVDVDDIPMSNDLMYYGAFFEVVCALATRAFGYPDDSQLGFHNIRHLLISILGVLTILFSGLTAREIFNWRAAFFAALVLFLTPRFAGHSLMNPKDLPFAFGYAFALFFLVRFLNQLPAPSWKTAAGLIAGIAISISIRIGGILLFAYLSLFILLFWLYFSTLKKNTSFNGSALKQIAVKVIVIIILGYFIGLLFWPFGLIDPIENPLAALARFSKYPAKINQLFEGEQIRSHKLPWYYLPKYLVISNPILLLAGTVLFPVLFYWMKKTYKRGLALVVLFLFVFPVAYIVIKKSTVYSGARHVLFVIPPMAVLAAVGWESLFQLLKSKLAKKAVAILMALLCANPLNWVIAQHPYQYVYFNPATGGVKKAYKNYTSDYWMLSVKEACEWLVKNVKQNQKIIVGTNCDYPVGIYLSNLADSFEVKYVRYYLKSDADWDYGIFYVDYVHPYQLQNGYYPPDHTIYTVAAGGAPLCVIIQRADKSD